MITSTVGPKRTKCGVLQMGNKKIFTYEGINLVGRNKEAVVILKDPIASIHHAIITIINDCHYVSDCKSTNGTKLDNVPLVPFRMYPIEDDNEINFTPKFSAKYKKLNANASQTSQLSATFTSQSTSQMTQTQTEEGFYKHNTQVDLAPVPVPIVKPDLFNDDLDDADLSNIVINTQVINSSVRKAPVDIHEAETQVLDFQPCSSKVNITEPTIYEAATQIQSETTSILSAFADTQFTQKTSKVQSNVENTKHLKNVSKVNKAAADTADRVDTQFALDGIDSMQVVEVEVGASGLEDVTNANTQESGGSNSTTGFGSPVNIADLTTQTVDPDTESERFTKNEVNTEGSLRLHLSTTQHDDDSMDMMEHCDPDALRAGYALAQTQSETKKLTQESRKDMISGSGSDEEDFSLNKSTNPGNNSSIFRKSRFILSDSEDEEEVQKVETLKATATPALVNDSFADCEDSFVQRKSMGDMSLDCIPATQEANATLSPAMQDSFKIGLSVVEEVSVASVLPLDDTQEHVSLCHDSIIDETFEADLQPQSSRLLKALLPDKEDDLFHDDNASQEIECAVYADTESVDFLAPTQSVHGVGVEGEKRLDVEDEFLAPTQPVCRRTRSARVSTGLNALNLSNDDCDFDVATQKLGKDTVSSEHRLKINDDSELFCMPTQSASGFMKSKQAALRRSKESQSEDFDFDAATQQISEVVKEVEVEVIEEVLGVDTQVLEDDDFAAATQAFVPDTDEKCVEVEESDIAETQVTDDFDAPTQAMIVDEIVCSAMETVENDRQDLAYTEAETQEVDALVPKVPTPIAPKIESQLEVMFETQNVSLSVPDKTRPLNPMANLLETTTQDVLESLSSPAQGTKRLSDQSDDLDVNFVKRAKTTSKRVETPQTKISRINTASIRNTPKPSTSKNKSILEFLQPEPQSDSVDNDAVKVSSKLSMIKKQMPAMDEDNSLSNDAFEVECLADTIPMKALDATKLPIDVMHFEESTLVDVTIGSAKKAKKRLMDLDSICMMPSPEPVKFAKPIVTEKNLMPNKTDTDENDTAKKSRKKTTKSKEPAAKKKTEAKASAPTRQTRQTRAESYSSKSSKSSKGSKSSKEGDSDKPKHTEVKTRTSSRAKKTVNYTDARTKISRTSSKAESSESEEDTTVRLVVKVPEEQPKFILADEEELNQTKAKKAVAEKPKRAGRTPVSKTAESVVASERNKRIVKPKVIFTMLDDPQLQKLVRSLGGSVVTALEKSTVLVTAKVQRTLKLLGAIANSIPICSPEWLQQCKEADEFLDPWDHLIRDADAEKQWNFSMDVALERSKKGKIFTGYQFLILVTLSADVIKGAIDANGGKVVSRKPSIGNFIVVASVTQKAKYETFLKNKIKVVSSEAVLIGILRQEIVFDDYLLR